jgi:CheY-like chemotaxis protein
VIGTKSTILYVDDDSDDCIFLKTSLEDQGNRADLVCASDGEEAVSYLNSVAPSSLPSLIVLDLNMPRWDGRRTLSYLKSQPHLAGIPVVILSTSENKNEQEACKQLGAVSCLKKPYHFDGYKSIVANFFHYMDVC